jgi:hypothetical protein
VTLPEPRLAPKLEPLYRACFEIAARVVLGSDASGTRIMIPITGGTFAGDRLSGEVMPGGADWQLVRRDGLVEIDARYVFRTHDGTLIAVHNVGVFHAPPDVMQRILRREDPPPSLYYMRTRPTFQTASPAYAWLERLVSVGAAELRAGRVLLDVFAVD